jgi:hypothetical protein
MKTLSILLIVLSYFIVSDYSQGFEDGHCEGFKSIRGQFTVCPVAPVAPVPKVGEDTYRGGYNAGFLRGRRDARN